MARALVEVRPPASAVAVAEWVREVGADFLDRRQKTLAANEESWRRTTLYAPPSGTRRAVTIATPSSVSSMSTSPSRVTLAFPASESGAYRMTSVAAPIMTLGARVRSSRALPWMAGGALVAAALVGGALRGASDPSPFDATNVDAGALSLTGAPSAGSGPSLSPPVPSAIVVATPSALGTAAPPPLVSLSRAVHPPPPPVRFTPSPRPTTTTVSVAPAPSSPMPSTATSSARIDCNPPFYFEGAKKIFKTNCL